MDPIYVTGHKNPDTDSIVSAIAFAALKNSLGNREYTAARLGNISDETHKVLEMFGAEPPRLIKNVRTQIRDLNYDTPPVLDKSVTINRAWETLTKEGTITVIPVVEEDNKIYGMITSGDIASYTMRTVSDSYVEDIPTYNLLSVLEGQVINKVDMLPEKVSGHVVIAVPQKRKNLVFSDPESIVLCGQQPDMIQHAIDIGVKLVIVCQADVDKSFRDVETGTSIIFTPYDAYRAARLIRLALPIERICSSKKIVYFNQDDYLDDVKDIMLKNRFRGYPVVDDEKRVLGTVGRYHLIRPKKKRVVLVDHNELSQSIAGLEEAEILGIIDHHRLADIQTAGPVFVRNEPLGSTATIVASMYQEKGLMPSTKIAGLLAAAIISDTVMFKSPTCTETDRTIAKRMAKIANVSLEKIGNAIFSSASEEKSVDEIIFSDYKEFLIADKKLGIGQVTCLNSDSILKRKPEIIKALQKKQEEREYDFILLMLTDVLKEGTELIYIGDDDTISRAYDVQAENNEVFLPHVMSRKKQIVPRLSELWG